MLFRITLRRSIADVPTATLVLAGALVFAHLLFFACTASAVAPQTEGETYSKLLQKQSDLLKVLMIREREREAVQSAVAKANVDEKKKLLLQRLTAVESAIRQTCVSLAANQLHVDARYAPPDIRSSVERLAGEMVALQKNPGPKEIERADKLHSAARLILVSSHLRRLGDDQGAEMVYRKAELLLKPDADDESPK